jgi:hypothetical protein
MQTLREWIRRMATRASGPGGGNSILRSILPGRSNAESRISVWEGCLSGDKLADKKNILGGGQTLVQKLATRTYSVGRHDDLDVLRRFKSVELI